MLNAMLSKWALIPALVLLVITFIFAGLVGMASEDLQREPTPLEGFLSSLLLIPMVWLFVIVAANWLGFKRWEGSLRAVCLILVIASLIGFGAAVFYLNAGV